MNSTQALEAALATINLTEHDFYAICIHPSEHSIALQGHLNADRLSAIEQAGFERVRHEGGKYVNHVGKVPCEDSTPLWRVETILT
jgi:hypothetical protein